ncbi:MAG TPA: plastocyanin/azurin family copper-binding protein [Vicinamibacterales bacterium]|nr:plastocyanin/azurin family copper-binding protein [Vicinamibacterales bacterium]
MQTNRFTLVVFLAVMAAACSQSGSTGPSPLAVTGDVARVEGQGGRAPSSAVIQFGQVNVGSPFQPSEHDQSAHAVDNLVPRTVVIRVGGTVTFNLPVSIHQIRIYKPGTDPEDINTAFPSNTTLAAFAGCGAPLPDDLVNAPLVINDPTNLEAAYPVPCLTPNQVVEHTFTTAGKYLVICAFLPHFNVGMYGWVEVKE